ncbi:MAG: hypothetical protein FJZ61_05160 [Chlamydiae bacterium]|nr:hypothetical protein [Chlamydiota bacterium]
MQPSSPVRGPQPEHSPQLSSDGGQSLAAKVSALFQKTKEFFLFPSTKAPITAEKAPPAREITRDSSFISGWSCKEKGNQLVWQQYLKDDLLVMINDNQFPSIQPYSADFRKLSEDQITILKNLGFSFSTGGFVSPTLEGLREILEMKESKAGFPKIQIVEVEDFLPEDEFLDLVLKGCFIWTKPPELIHDVWFHIIPQLLNFTKDPAGYQAHIKVRNDLVKGILVQLAEADAYPGQFLENLNPIIKEVGGKEIDTEAWYLVKSLIKYSLGAYLDGETSLILKEIPNISKTLKMLINGIVMIVLNETEIEKKWQKVWSTVLGFTKKDLLEAIPKENFIATIKALILKTIRAGKMPGLPS